MLAVQDADILMGSKCWIRTCRELVHIVEQAFIVVVDVDLRRR